MKKLVKSSVALLLAVLMLLQVGEAGLAYAAQEIDKVVNPAKYIELTVPETYKNGENWFFIAKSDWLVSEKSADKLYIPIQRSGDLNAEADVTLKVIDLSARHDVNYTVEVYKEDVEPEIAYADISIVDLVLTADSQQEIELGDENDLGETIYEAGGADIVDTEGNVLGSVTATKLDEDGNPIAEADEPDESVEDTEEANEAAEEAEQTEKTAEDAEETAPEDTDVSSENADSVDSDAEPVTPGEVEESEWTETKPSGTSALRAARNSFTGTISDRQELTASDPLSQNSMTDEELAEEMSDAVEDGYPGKEYTLHFNAGEEAKFLVITPMYSEAAEGDSQVLLMLKNPGEGYKVGEDVNPVSVTILDEDEPEEVTVSMADETVTAADGKAVITVTRSGRVNAIKGVRIASWDGRATAGDEYSGVGANLYFSMGVTSRTVEIPVYHGTVEKDFYVTITPLDDETIGTATTRVIIPAAEITSEKGDGALMGVKEGESRTGSPVSGPLYIKNDSYSGRGYSSSDTSFCIYTPYDVEWSYSKWFHSVGDTGYAYDGMYTEFDAFVNWCESHVWMSFWRGSSGTNVDQNNFDCDGWSWTHWLWNYWGDPKAPDRVSVETVNVDNSGYAWTDDYISVYVNGLYLMKRQFDIVTEPAEVKPLIGRSDNYVLTNYEAVLMDNSTYANRTLWTSDSFAISAKNEKGPLRLVGVEAKMENGAWYRIASIDGKSSTVTVELNPNFINNLAAQKAISWVKRSGTPSGRRTSYKGVITIRPVFDYINATVELKSSEYGKLNVPSPNPSMLWDFGGDNAMSAKMGVYSKADVSYSGGKDGGGNEYYTFTASGGDPRVSVDTHAESVNNIQWVKVRAKNLSGAKAIELFASVNNSLTGASCTHIELASDNNWHEYIVHIPEENVKTANAYKGTRLTKTAWSGIINWIRLDPMWKSGDGSISNGNQIQIDYVAFFPDEESAKAFRNTEYIQNGLLSHPGAYTYHLGDSLKFTSTVDSKFANTVFEDGFYYELRKGYASGELINNVDPHYVNKQLDFAINGESLGGTKIDDPYYSFQPTFTDKNNRIEIRVYDSSYDKFDLTKGVFAEGNYLSKEHQFDYWSYVIDRNILANDIYELHASAKDSNVIPMWTVADGSSYYGEDFYIRSGSKASDNIITLAAESANDFTYVVISGTVVSSTYNMSTERSATDMNPVKNAYVALGKQSTLTDEDGHFNLPFAVQYKSGAKIRYTVTYNGVTSLREVQVPAGKSKTASAITITGSTVNAVNAKAEIVKVDSFSETGAHFTSVYANQKGQLVGAVNAITMNGKALNINVEVATDTEYTLNNKVYTEHIKDVTLYFMNQYTGEIHGQYSSNTEPANPGQVDWTWDEDEGQFTLKIKKFSPDMPEEWTYGDVLMARLITDKKAGITAWDNDTDMVYEPVSTGFGVYADPKYEPTTFQYDIDDLADALGVTPQTDADGNLLDETECSFGSFPYIGEITAAVHILTDVYSSTAKSLQMDNLKNSLSKLSGSNTGNATVSDSSASGGEGQKGSYSGTFLAFFDIQDTVYGGVRIMLGVIYTYDSGDADDFKDLNDPFRSPGEYLSMMRKQVKQSKMGGANAGSNPDVKNLSEFGGGYFAFSAFVGLYLDFGYIEISTEKTGADGKPITELSHEKVFMGAGGFIGANANIGYTWTFVLIYVPAYINVEAGLEVTFFLGSEGDPKKTLESFENEKEMKGQDFAFNFEFNGRIYASGSFGVGLYKLLGIRATVTLAFEAGYSNRITDWNPHFDTGWGYVSDITLGGTVDLIVTSIDLGSASWALPLHDGFKYYYQEVDRADRCVSYVRNGISDGKGSEADRKTAEQMCDDLEALVESNKASGDDIRSATFDLKSWAWHHDIISWVAKNTIEMNKVTGIGGFITEAALEDDSETGSISYHTNNHVNSQWIAGDGELMAAYSAVRSSQLVEDAYTQPSSKIISIGNNQYLMVFLDDTASRDKMQAATLKWTVYDASNDTWTTPQVVQDDSTADSKPSLTDAGDKVILSWASSTDEKYEALKAEIAKEIDSSEEALIQAALENDPARALSVFDAFTVEFDKSSQSFGEICQLTDDMFYDDYPQAIYDSETGDYIVMYYKTAQDDEAYTSNGDKLQDLIGASSDPNKTYSVLCYMLYNNQTDAADTLGNTHSAGWARDYYFPLETAESLEQQVESLEAWKGQRFVWTGVMNEDGTAYDDPPIYDLTVCEGYNGLAVYSFTVDKDFNLDTAEDRELYAEIYNFKTHGTYYPIRVAGSVTEERESYDSSSHSFVTAKATRQVEVGTPKLIRNGGSTFLFWREDGKTLKYLNVTELLNAKVAAVADPGESESDWTYALRSDGKFAVDAMTGEAYSPDVKKVDFGSGLTDDDIHITDYEVITDEDDNLYVVWTDTVTNDVTDEVTGETSPVAAQEIYATGLIKQNETIVHDTDENVTGTTHTVRWSKPYRLTKENNYNDGIALALDEDGGLIIVHNQYSKLTAQSEDEMMQLVRDGKISITEDREGNLYAASLTYNSPVSLMVTRCDKVGSLEATKFTFSDESPVAGQTIAVNATIENVGLTDAEGSDIRFYEYKDGVRGKLIASAISEDIIQVNTAKYADFLWTIPDEGPEGYRIQAVIREKKADGSYYDDVESFSDAFKEAPAFSLDVTDIKQEGDKFRVSYSVENSGNADAYDGTSLELRLVGLYGNLGDDRYGNLKSDVLYSEDVTGQLKAKTAQTIEGEDDSAIESLVYDSVYETDALVEIPVSVFRYCGYDAIEAVVADKDGNVLENSSQHFVRLAEPVNLSLNDGETIMLTANSTEKVALDCDTTTFIDKGFVVYTAEDPNVISVDENGNVTALGNGTTKLTATLLPYGSSASTYVTVSSGAPNPTDVPADNPPSLETKPNLDCDGGEGCPMTRFTDLDRNAWYHDGVHWALENEIMNGYGEGKFEPSTATSRAMIVTMLHRMEGSPIVNYAMSFTDVEDGKWYTEAIRWAAANGIVEGYSKEKFEPTDELTREQLATILYRYARIRGLGFTDTGVSPLTYYDASEASGWANEALCWMTMRGVINGTGSNKLSPKGSATRAQVATMLMRFESVVK